MGWLTDATSFVSRHVDDAENLAGDVLTGNVGAIGVKAFHLGQETVSNLAGGGRAPPALQAPTVAQISEVAPASQRAGTGSKLVNETPARIARAQVGKWLPSDLPNLTENALYEIKEGGTAPAYPGLLWDAAAKTYKADPKGMPKIATVIRNGTEMTVSDAAFLDKRDNQWAAEDAGKAVLRAGGSTEEAAAAKAAYLAAQPDAVRARKRRMWLYVGGGVAVVLLLGAVAWWLSSKKKA